MKEITWDVLKSEKLKKARGASFEDVLSGELIGIKKNPTRENQKIMLFKYKRYIWVVPFVTDKNNNIFLKTLYPSRKYTKLSKGGQL